MSTVLDSFTSQLQGDTLSKISRQVGADEDATSQAIAMALPVLLAGLARNAATPTGAQSLEQALDGDHDGSLLNNLSSIFGGQGDSQVSSRATNGAGILEHILGARRAPVEQSIGKASGLNFQQVAKLMVLVAPLVMAYLGRRKREQASGVGSILQQEQSEIERRAPGAGGILGQILGGGQGIDASQLGMLGGLFGGKKAKSDFSNVRSDSSTAAQPVTPSATARKRTYTVMSGDSLSKIAQREYGEAGKWKAIFEANRDQIKDPDLIHPGQVLTLPDNV